MYCLTAHCMRGESSHTEQWIIFPIALLFLQFCQCIGRFCVIVNFPLLPTVIKTAGIIWKACNGETRHGRSFSTFAQLEIPGQNPDPRPYSRQTGIPPPLSPSMPLTYQLPAPWHTVHALIVISVSETPYRPHRPRPRKRLLTWRVCTRLNITTGVESFWRL